MIRLVLGLLLLGIALLGFVGVWLTPDEPAGIAFLGILVMFVLPGLLLSYLGKRAMGRREIVLEMALRMLRESDGIDTREIALKINFSEIKVREVIVKAQRGGIIPFKAEMQ